MFYDTFLQLCSIKKKTPSAVATDLGLSKTTVYFWKTGRNEPSDSTIMKVASYFQVDFRALKEGRIEPVNTKPSEEDPKPSTMNPSIDYIAETDDGVQMLIEFASKYSKLTEQEQQSINAVIDTFLSNHK